jgi:toxin YoeB
MNVLFTSVAWSDYLYWQANDRAKIKQINKLIHDVVRQPFQGIGKPEPLKWDLAGCWSRRIDAEHRLVYRVVENAIHILACRYHYNAL